MIYCSDTSCLNLECPRNWTEWIEFKDDPIERINFPKCEEREV